MTDAQTEARALLEAAGARFPEYEDYDAAVDIIATALAAKDAELAAERAALRLAADRADRAEAQLAEANKDLDQFMDHLGPRWFLEQNWFPTSVDARRAREQGGENG